MTQQFFYISVKIRDAESRTEDTDETFVQITWPVAVRLLTKFFFKEPVIKLKYCGVREHMRKHDKQS